MKHECDLVYTQLRHIFNRLKEDAGQGRLASTQMIQGILIDTSQESTLDECMADLWRMMRAAVKQKYWRDYLSPEAELRLEEEESGTRKKVLRESLLVGGAPTASGSGVGG